MSKKLIHKNGVVETGRTSSHYSLNYKGAKRRLFRLDHKKVKVLRCFKQDHIIKKFDELSEVEDKRNLNRQIELLDLDIIDLVKTSEKHYLPQFS